MMKPGGNGCFTSQRFFMNNFKDLKLSLMIKGPARGQWTLHVSGDNNDNDDDDDDDVSAEHRPHEVQDGNPQRDHQTRH